MNKCILKEFGKDLSKLLIFVVSIGILWLFMYGIMIFAPILGEYAINIFSSTPVSTYTETQLGFIGFISIVVVLIVVLILDAYIENLIKRCK